MTQRLQSRAAVGNVLFALLATTGVGLTYWAFQDPENGRYLPDVDFVNWSGTHSVTCR